MTLLDPALRSDPSMAKFAGKAVNDLARAHLEAVKFIGKSPESLVDVSDPTKVDATALLRRLGAPEKPDGYTFTPPEGTPDALKDGPVLDWFRKTAAEIGILPSQAQKLYQGLVENTQAGAAEVSKQAAAGLEALQREWGPQFEVNAKTATAAADELGIRDVLNDAGLGAHPAVVKALVKVGKVLLSDGGQPGAGGSTTLSPAAAVVTADRLTSESIAAAARGDRATATRLANEALALRERVHTA